MQAGMSLSSALDPPGRHSTLVHSATVNSLPSGHRCLSGPLHSALCLPLLSPPRVVFVVMVVVTHCRKSSVAAVSQPPVSSPGSSSSYPSVPSPLHIELGGQEIRHTVHKVNTVRPVCLLVIPTLESRTSPTHLTLPPRENHTICRLDTVISAA